MIITIKENNNDDAEHLAIRDRFETIKTTAWLRSARILRRVLGT